MRVITRAVGVALLSAGGAVVAIVVYPFFADPNFSGGRFRELHFLVGGAGAVAATVGACLLALVGRRRRE